MTRVLIVDDDPAQLRLTAELANDAGFKPLTATSGEQALKILRTNKTVAAVILDLVMPDIDGMAVMEIMAREGLSVPIIVQAVNPSPETIITLMRQGASDYVTKPVSPQRLIMALGNAIRMQSLQQSVRREQSRRTGTLALKDMVAKAEAMDRVAALAIRAAKTPSPVLIEGEAGVGKTMLARIIAGSGERAGKPFVTLDCGATSWREIDSALFGHKKGAFANAHADVPGKLSLAHGGTLYLKDVGALPLESQEKLLAALQSGEILPLGASRAEKINVRVISATTRRLLNFAKSGELREDLFYYLTVLPIYLPPLRERASDIAALVDRLIVRFSAETGRHVSSASPAVLKLLVAYDWPGNVAQLESLVYRAVTLADGDQLEPADFPQLLKAVHGRDAASLATQSREPMAEPVHIDIAPARQRETESQDIMADRFVGDDGQVNSLIDLEKAAIAFAITHYSGRMSQVARALKIGRSTLYRKLHEYELTDLIESDVA